MKVTQEKLPASRVGLEIEITPEMSKQAYEKTLQQFTRNANIPGFRPGKVPRPILIQRLGPKRIKMAVLEELIDEGLKRAIEQEKIDAIGNFELRSPFETLVEQFEPGSAFTFSASVDVPPEAELKTYTGFTIQAEEIAYDPARVDETLESYRERNATRVPVEGRPAQEQDFAVIDFAGHLADAGDAEEPQEIPGGSAQNFEIELVEGRFIPGFIEGIIGMNVGDAKEVALTFPDPYPQADLAGKAAIFTITLKELKEKELPELDDDFAQDISDFETLAELRESLSTRFKEEADNKTKTNKQEAILNELVQHLEVELPETLIRREVDYMITQTAMRFGDQGMDIKKVFTPDIVKMLREQSRDEAIKRIKRSMALGEIAKKESIKVDEATIDAKVQEYLGDLDDDSSIDQDQLKQVIEEDLLKEQIFEWLESQSTIELVPEGTLKTDTAEPIEADAEQLEPVESEPEAVAEAEVASPTESEPAAKIEVAPESEVESEPDASVKSADRPKASKGKATEAKTDVEAEAPAKAPSRRKSRSKSAKSDDSSPSEDA